MAELDINKVCRNTDLGVTKESARHSTTAGLAEGLVSEDREGQLMLQIPATNTAVHRLI